MTGQDQQNGKAIVSFETIRAANGRWLCPAAMAEPIQTDPAATTTLAKTRVPEARTAAPIVTSPTQVAAASPGSSTAGDAPKRRDPYAALEPIEPNDAVSESGDPHPFFQNDIPRSKKEQELFDIESDQPGSTGPHSESDADNTTSTRRNVLEWAVVLVAAVLLALVLRAFLVQAFYIPSPSMESTLEVNDRVLVNKLSYRFGDVERGNVVVFHRTDDEIAASPDLPADVIKRVIGLPGETVEIKDNTIYVDGAALSEPYLEPEIVNANYGPIVVEEGKIFVMGDNRSQSDDSRGSLGQIEIDRVVGRAFVLFWPLGRFDNLSSPAPTLEGES